MLRIAPAVSFALCLVASLGCVASPRAASAATFVFDHLLDTSGGVGANGTPRGLTVAGGDLLVSDALNDEIYRYDPAGAGTLTATYDADPFVCAASAVPADCTPTQDWARLVWDVAWDGSSIWAVDKESINGSATWLIELNAAGEFLRRIDVSTAGADPGGLAYDPRGAGGILLTDRGADQVVHLDLDGILLGVSSISAFSSSASGIAYFGNDVLFIADSSTNRVYEADVPNGGGTAALIGETIFQGFDPATLVDLQGVDYDASTETLYLLDGGSHTVYVFTLVPEPGSALLLGLGLVALGARRRLGGRQAW